MVLQFWTNLTKTRLDSATHYIAIVRLQAGESQITVAHRLNANQSTISRLVVPSQHSGSTNGLTRVGTSTCFIYVIGVTLLNTKLPMCQDYEGYPHRFIFARLNWEPGDLTLATSYFIGSNIEVDLGWAVNIV